MDPLSLSESEEEFYYFAYGSNMHTKRLEDRVGKVALEGIGTLADYMYRFSKKSWDGGKANVEPALRSQVSGVVFRLTEKQLKILDAYEGTPIHYRREIVLITLSDGRPLRAIVYIAPPDDLFQPSPSYLQWIIDGAIEHGIPTEPILQAAQLGEVQMGFQWMHN